jgi:hypothetical protein
MENSNKIQYREAQILMKALHHHLITHAVSFKGRLSPAEEDTLANIFHAQINLQAILAEALSPNRHKSELKPELNQTSSQVQASELSQEFLIEMSGILSQLSLYAKLLYSITVGDEASEAAEYATQITRIINFAQDRVNQYMGSSSYQEEPAILFGSDQPGRPYELL